MKPLIVIIFISLVCSACVQKPLFVRVYNLSGEKKYKGNVISLTDSSLLLAAKKISDTISVKDIGFIKTKHSAGNNLLIGSLSGAVPVAVIGAATADPDALILGYTAGEGAAAGALIGLAGGVAIGGLTALLKNSETFLINGDLMKWKAFQSYISEKQHGK